MSINEFIIRKLISNPSYGVEVSPYLVAREIEFLTPKERLRWLILSEKEDLTDFDLGLDIPDGAAS